MYVAKNAAYPKELKVKLGNAYGIILNRRLGEGNAGEAVLEKTAETPGKARLARRGRVGEGGKVQTGQSFHPWC